MRNFRKISSLVLALTLAIGTIGTKVSVKAEEITPDAQETLVSQSVQNEYDMYKSFMKKSDETLKNEGYSDTEIKSMKSQDYVSRLTKKVEKCNKLDEGTLRKLGYSKEQIKMIREYNGSEEQVYALSASLWLSTYVLSYSKSSSYSQVTCRTDFTWTSCPVWLETDIVAATWSEGLYAETSSSYTYGKYDYYDEWTDTYDRTIRPSVSPCLNTGISMKVDMGFHNNDIGGLYAKKGSLGYKMSRQALVEQISIEAKYGHQQWVVSPSVSFGLPSSISISFNSTCNEEATNYKYVDL